MRRQLLFYSLGEGELYCSPIEAVTNIRASGPMPSSFEETDYCTNRCDPQSCVLAQDRSNACRIDMSCCVYFSSVV